MYRTIPISKPLNCILICSVENLQHFQRQINILDNVENASPSFRISLMALQFPGRVYKQSGITLYFFPKYLFYSSTIFNRCFSAFPKQWSLFSAVLRRFLKATSNSLDFFILIDFYFAPFWFFISTKFFFATFLANRNRIEIQVNISFLDSNFDSSQYYLRLSPTHSCWPTWWYLFDKFIIKYLNLTKFDPTNELII